MTSTIEIQETSVERIHEIFDLQKRNRYRVGTTTAKERIEKLKKLRRAVMAFKDQVHVALMADSRKHPGESNLLELFPTTSELNHAIDNLEKWMTPKKVSAPIALIGSKGYVMP
ncbi:MAG: aldehyde dehydrogenase family protein, partial [Bacteroidota bacterium]